MQDMAVFLDQAAQAYEDTEANLQQAASR